MTIIAFVCGNARARLIVPHFQVFDEPYAFWINVHAPASGGVEKHRVARGEPIRNDRVSFTIVLRAPKLLKSLVLHDNRDVCKRCASLS